MNIPPLTSGNVSEILQCLKAALEPGTLQKQAEQHLAGLELRPGFCSCLAEIMLDKEADHSARWLASVQLKNSITKHWRSRNDPRAISAAEKAHLRTVLPHLIVQDDNQVAVQVALTWAKVARQDYPSEWPSLFSDLMSMLSSPGASQLSIRRTLLVTHHAVKELATKRLAADQKHFAQVAAQLFQAIWSQWVSDTSALLAGLPGVLGEGATPPQGVAQQLLVTLERWLILLKISRRLLIFGHISDHKSLQPVQEVSVCAPAMLQALQQLVALRPPGGSKATQRQAASGGVAGHQRHLLTAMLERGLLKLSKVMVCLQDHHPWSFHACGVLTPCMTHCYMELMSNQEHGGGMAAAAGAWDRYLIQCMSFLMNVLNCSAYQGKSASGSELSKSHEQDAPRLALAAEVRAVLNNWWTPDKLTSLCKALATSYCRLTARDIDEWWDDSEEFYHAGDISGWQEHVGLAAEALYLILLQNHRALLGPLVSATLQEATASCPLETLATQPAALQGGALPVPGQKLHVPHALLYLEAALGAVAKGAYELHDYLEYSPWLRAHLLPILATDAPLLRILRRAALKVIAQCVARLEDADRPAVYQAVLKCMHEHDECIKLTAVHCLHSLIDDWNFNEQQFEPFVATAMQCLLQTLTACSQLDSQTQAFNLMNLIIERMGDLIRPWVEPLAGLLPNLWRSAEGQSLLRIQVLLAFQRLVNVLGSQCPSLYLLVLELLQYSTDPDQPESLQLLEDGMGLWLVTVRNAPAYDPHLVSPLVPNLPKILSGSTEHIAIAMAVISSIALLAQDNLAAHSQAIDASFSMLLGNVNERGTLLLLPTLELCLACCPAMAAALRPTLVKMVTMLLHGKESGQVQAACCCVLSRLLLAAPSELPVLLQAVTASVASSGTAVDPVAVLTRVLELWTEHFDSLAQPKQRKLSALGLCALVAHAASGPVLSGLDTILACVTGVWAELEAGPPQGLTGHDTHDESDMWADLDSGFEAVLSVAVASEDAEGECNRRQQMRARDPVSGSSLKDALRSALEAARGVAGPALDAALAAVDPTIAGQLQAMMTYTGNGARLQA